MVHTPGAQPPLLFRTVRPTDIAVAYAVIKRSWSTYYSPVVSLNPKKRIEEVRQDLLSTRGWGTLVYVDATPVAVMLIKEQATHTELDFLFVAPGFTSLGIGSRLMDILKKCAGKRIEVQVVASNWRGRKFYERHGGKVLRRTFGRVPSLWYQLAIR